MALNLKKIFITIFLFVTFLSYNLNANSDELLAHDNQKIWSILICTLEERFEVFEHIFSKVSDQIAKLNLQDQVEILYIKDNRGISIGTKRNRLLDQSKALYVSFLDDDDDVHEDYIKLIYDKLLEKPDCVSLSGIISYHGQHSKLFIHSLKYDHYFEENGIYYRPPNHWNPIRRDIACQFKFPEINYGEDTCWAMEICRSKLLKTEVIIEEPYYFYLCSDNPLSIYF